MKYHIKNLKIKNFTIFSDVALSFHNFNIFVGENNTGKSHLLKLIYSLLINGSKHWSLQTKPNNVHLNSSILCQ